jgi:small subunit ribosomal protein S6
MFLVDSAMAASNWDSVNNAIKTILERADAEIVSIRKWDDRKLAYEIRRVSRGVYLLCYFRVNGEKIKDIEHSVQLSEQIMRVLILNAEHMTTEDIEKDTPATKAEKDKQKSNDEADEKKQEEQQGSSDDSGDVKEPEKKDEEAEQTPEDEVKQAPEDEVKQTPEDEVKQDSVDEVKQDQEDEVEQGSEDEAKQDSEEKTEDEQESEPPEISKD